VLGYKRAGKFVLVDVVLVSELATWVHQIDENVQSGGGLYCPPAVVGQL
jgi:hypothetical protein